MPKYPPSKRALVDHGPLYKIHINRRWSVNILNAEINFINNCHATLKKVNVNGVDKCQNIFATERAFIDHVPLHKIHMSPKWSVNILNVYMSFINNCHATLKIK